MKKIVSFLKGLLISVWALVAIVTTILLLSFNGYGVSEIGDYSIFIVDNERLEPTFLKNDLVITKKVAENKYSVGDFAFFYIDNPEDAVFINYGQINKIVEANHAEDSYYFGDDSVAYGKLIGPANGSIVYHKVGLILSILESKWGFMFFIIFPTIFAVVYEIYSIVEEVKSKNDEDEDE